MEEFHYTHTHTHTHHANAAVVARNKSVKIPRKLLILFMQGFPQENSKQKNKDFQNNGEKKINISAVACCLSPQSTPNNRLKILLTYQKIIATRFLDFLIRFCPWLREKKVRKISSRDLKFSDRNLRAPPAEKATLLNHSIMLRASRISRKEERKFPLWASHFIR